MSEELLTAVAQRLRAQLPAFVVDAYPDDEARFAWSGASRHLLVAPEGSTFGEPASHDPLHVEETVRLSVTVLVRSLRGELGAVTALTAIRRALFGWRAELSLPEGSTRLGFGPLVPERSGFVSERQGVWRWVITFRASTVAVAESEPLTGPPLKSVEIRDA